MMNRLTDCRLTLTGWPDTGSIPALVRDIVGSLPRGASVEDRVLALYRYARRRLFAYVGTVDDLIEPLNKAVYTLNWWGFGLCGRQAKTLGVLAAELLGPDNVRIVGMGEREAGAWRVGQDGRPYAFYWTMFSSERQPGQLYGHTSLEVRWDGAWHFLDVMVGFYRRDETGRIVSLQEILDRPELADRPVGDPEGDMPYGPEPEIFTGSTVKHYRPGLNTWPGTLPPLDLRPGESFTFLPASLPGEFVIHPQQRARFVPEAIDGGPREGRRNARPARYGNGEHVYRVRLRPDDSSPFWCPQTADWHVPVELPYPVTSIHWEMAAVRGRGKPVQLRISDCGSRIGNPQSAVRNPQSESASGFLHFPASTADTLLSIDARGCRRAGPDAVPGTGYRIVVRAPDRRGAVDLTLRTIVQLNPLVVPRLSPGENVLRLRGAGRGKLTARLTCTLNGRPRTFKLAGAGRHVVRLPALSTPADQSITLANEAR